MLKLCLAMTTLSFDCLKMLFNYMTAYIYLVSKSIEKYLIFGDIGSRCLIDSLIPVIISSVH